ncbi:unnamed protein product [Spirodela intermedia]|uniref:Biogenesis of lysosome-related organelles complex 1 subunit 7 n=1 Tax=Spirodela intermedia TaxID=51605 RepID=A0A7I8JIF8_SPIIN|nr:unnamed protein product [Spirodela intermedia]CAA6669937.1 unnamed protein product [Spirodela intermedia]
MDGGNGQHSRRPGPVESPGCDSVPDDEELPCAAPRSDLGESDVSGDLARVIASVLAGVLEDYDAKTEAVARSQDVLGLSLDRLNGELDKLLEEAPLPFIMQHAAKISGIRKRIFALNSILKTVQKRIDNMDIILSAASPHIQLFNESVRPNSHDRFPLSPAKSFAI